MAWLFTRSWADATEYRQRNYVMHRNAVQLAMQDNSSRPGPPSAWVPRLGGVLAGGLLLALLLSLCTVMSNTCRDHASAFLKAVAQAVFAHDTGRHGERPEGQLKALLRGSWYCMPRPRPQPSSDPDLPQAPTCPRPQPAPGLNLPQTPTCPRPQPAPDIVNNPAGLCVQLIYIYITYIRPVKQV